MRKLILLIAAVLLASCAAGGRASGGHAGNDVPSTAAAPVLGASTVVLGTPTIVPTLDPTAVAAVPTAEPGAPFVGPLLLLFLENTYEESYLGLFDAGNGAFREVPGSIGYYLNEVQWIDDGCGLFVRGQVLDLKGAPGWSLPSDVVAAVPDLSLARLSPDRRWLAYAVPGEAGANVEAIALAPPYERVTLTRNGGASSDAMAWAADSSALYVTDRDEAGVLQLYHAVPEEGVSKPLTAHTDPDKAINVIAPSPDGRGLAYAAREQAAFQQPYSYDPADEGWIGLIDLESGEQARVTPAKLGAVESGRGLWWDASGASLVAIGDSLPIPPDDPLAGRRAHWITAGGEVTRSFHQKDAPGGYAGWMTPLPDIRQLLLSGADGNYTLTAGGFERVPAALMPPVGQTMDRRVIGILPAPLAFPGESRCPERAP
jgi:hypothetical protein